MAIFDHRPNENTSTDQAKKGIVGLIGQETIWREVPQD
jgi:hypothetical protein